MGKSKTTKWWRSLLGFTKSSPETSSSASVAAPPLKEKKRSKWAISKPVDIKFTFNEDIILGRAYGAGMDASKHAVAVAAATAAVAEAALAAAQAAAEVVRLTSGGGNGRNYVRLHVRSDRRRVAAAVKIQSAFRAYLARRALRALKGLVKLQALVRGHIVRKQSSDMLRRMQAMARIQARASAHRSCVSESSNTNVKSSYSGHPHRNTKESFIDSNRISSNWFDHWMEQSTYHCTRHDTSPEIDRLDDERSDKILEIDTWKPRQNVRRKEKFNFSHHLPQSNDTASRLSTKPSPSVTSWEMSSMRSPSFPLGWTTEISPTAASALAGSDGGRSFAPKRSEYRDYLGSKPSYMANTESSRTKVRSQSTPKQRMRLEASGISDHRLSDTDAHSEKGYDDVNSGRGAPQCLSSSYGI